MPEATILELMQTLYEVLPVDRTAITNKMARARLSRQIGMDVPLETYHEVRAALKNQGLVTIGMGPGGLVARKYENPPDTIVTPAPDLSEKDLYPLTIKYLNEVFRHEINVEDEKHIIQDTSTGGPPTGKWSRPDVTMITSKYHRFTNNRSITIYSFEVKTQTACNLSAIYEAHEQGVQTHYPYVIWHVPVGPPDENTMMQMKDGAQRNGVGLILLRDKQKNSEIVVSPVRRSPDIEIIERYISKRINVTNQTKIIGWHRQT